MSRCLLKHCDKEYSSWKPKCGKGGAGPSLLHTTHEGPTEWVCECKMDVKSTCIIDHLDYFQKPSLGGRPNTKPEDPGTPNTQNRWCILFYHVWGPAWEEIHWKSISLRTWSHMTSHYTQGSMTTLYGSGGVLGRPLDTFRWALTISWSQLLAQVWSGPKFKLRMLMNMIGSFITRHSIQVGWCYHLSNYGVIVGITYQLLSSSINLRNDHPVNTWIQTYTPSVPKWLSFFMNIFVPKWKSGVFVIY